MNASHHDINKTHSLSAALRQRIRGEIRFDNGSRALYATDGSNYRQTPIGVVIPRDKDDLIEAVRTAAEYHVPITSRGAGTSLAGECCNTTVIIDTSKYYNHVLRIDPAARVGVVEPGCILDHFRGAAADYDLTFGPDPATHNHCTIGGMLGNDSCGIHSVMAAHLGEGARVADNTHALEILTYDGLQMRVGPTSEQELERIIQEGGRRGEIYARLRNLRDKYADEIRNRFPNIPRRVSGYNLPQLLPENGFNVARALVGSEGTCVTILGAEMNLIPALKARSLVVLGYPDVYTAGDHCPEIMKFQPVGLEGIDHTLTGYMEKRGLHAQDIKFLPEGKGWLLVEFGADTQEEADSQAHHMMEVLKKQANHPQMKFFDEPDETQKLWEIRESGLGATAFVPGLPPAWPGWEDSAVPPDKVGSYLRALKKLFDKFDYQAALYGHFGQGCIHCRIDFDLRSEKGLKKYRAFVGEAADLVVSYGGSLSGEHGDGQSRAELLPKMFGPEIMKAFQEFKAIWDPDNHMNPGKVIDPYPILSNLRLGADYNPWRPRTYFQFPEDKGDFSHAALRCVGVGKCRRMEGGTMCPSFMVTREEKDTTRGRAHLLFEMLRGETIGKNGWKDDHVKESLDLCLACKGCKGDCPVNVDMATYKAEFLAHYFKGRLRPVTAYSMGLIYWWARAASYVPRIANFFSDTRPFSSVFKACGGIAPQRKVPSFATETFRHWFARRPASPSKGRRVILWPDTFNNFFHPEIAQAAVEVLELAGCDVILPRRLLCCGRPLYDWGMLDLAQRQLRQILDALRDEIRAGTPVIGLEPSCVSVFRDELKNLFPQEQDAVKLSQQTYFFPEFFHQKLSNIPLPQFSGHALVHGHCHQKSIADMKDEVAILHSLGLNCNMPATGCCGMAGAFGFERENYDISVKCGDRVLLPAVRDTSINTLIVTDGFSCREQIEQLTTRRPLHIAEVLRLAFREGSRRKSQSRQSASSASAKA